MTGSPYVPFLPNDALINKPVYLAYNAFCPDHYDGTRVAESDEISSICVHVSTVCVYMSVRQCFRVQIPWFVPSVLSYPAPCSCLKDHTE